MRQRPKMGHGRIGAMKGRWSMYARQVTLEVRRPMTVPVNSIRLLETLDDLGASEFIELPAQRIADRMGCARPTCVSRIHQAEELGLVLVRERIGGSGVQLSHEYRILDLGRAVLDEARRSGIARGAKED